MTCPFERVFVRVVGRYKHLGTWYAAGGSMAFEIRSRLSQAHAEFSRLRRLVFGKHLDRLDIVVFFFIPL